MKLFRLTIGNTEAYGVAESIEEMEEKKEEVDHTFAFLPVRIEELTVPGYEIIVKPVADETEGTTTRRRKSAAQ